MANEINGVYFKSTYGLGKINEKPEEKTSQKESKQPQPETKNMAEKDVFSYLNATSLNARPKEIVATKIDPSKYVNAESAARIGKFLSQFEDIIAKDLKPSIENEFGNALTEEAKMDLALEMFKVKYM